MKRHPEVTNARRNLLFSAMTLVLAAGSIVTNACAQEAGERVNFEVPAQSASSALNQFAEQADITLVFSEDTVSGVTVRRLQGSFTTQQGLAAMLEGTGLSWRTVDGRTISITRGDSRSSSSESGGKSQDLEKIVVTGTRIRGGTTASPIITIGSERIREEGFTDLGEVIRSIPQNYAGGQNPGVTAGAHLGGYYNLNITGGSSANLRGIGQDATLTLLNNRRPPYGGYNQAVDISAIPVDAVERIEVVTDGASAIYGSDAVAGVINVVLRRDFHGLAVSAHHGEASEGGLGTQEYTATVGTTWSSGGLIAAFKVSDNDPVYADQRDFTRNMYQPTTLYQEGELKSGLFSMHQSLGDSVELHLDMLRTERSMQTLAGLASSYTLSPAETTTTMVAPELVFRLPNDWVLNMGATFGRDSTEFASIDLSRTTGQPNWSVPYHYSNKSRMYEVGAEGPAFSLPGGDARIAVGAGYRQNVFLNFFNGGKVADGEEASRFAYAELGLPFVDPGQNVMGVHRLGLTAAVRTEDYDSFGRVTTPKVGLIYSPSADWSVKASWGESFKTPTLYQGHITQFSYLYQATILGGASGSTALYLSGGNLDLVPEQARTWNASIAFHPEMLPALEMELTAFHIDYTDRIIQPMTSISEVLSTSTYADFVTRSPTAAQQADVIARTQFANYSGVPYDPATMVAIVDNRFVNSVEQRIKGVDLSGSYRFDIAAGRLTIRGSASWMDIEQALTTTSGFSDGAGMLFHPAKVSSRVGTVWNQGGFTASLFGNYKSGVTSTLDGTKGGAFTTFDTTIRYDSEADGGVFANMGFELSVQNLLNREPPLYATTVLSNAPYDSTNYSAIGRYVSLAVSKRW